MRFPAVDRNKRCESPRYSKIHEGVINRRGNVSPCVTMFDHEAPCRLRKSRENRDGVEYKDGYQAQPAGTENYHNVFIVRVNGTETNVEEARDSWHDQHVG